MAHSFRVGQMVRVVNGPRKGAITTVATGLLRNKRVFDTACGITRRMDVHLLTLVVDANPDWPITAPPAWLEPYHEPGDFKTLDELIRNVVPAGKVSA